MRTISKTSMYAWLLSQVRELEPGKAFEARRGQHYTCESQSFTQAVYAVAAQNGYKATCSVFETSVVYCFYRADSYLRPNLPAYPVVKKMRRF